MATDFDSLQQTITLYDNPSRFGTGTTWSPNVWKTRLLLNFKGLPYKTEWLHGPELAPTFKSLGIPPHPPKTQPADWTIPAVRMPSGEYVMESKIIVMALEKEYLEPTIHLDSPALKQVEEAMVLIYRHMRSIFVPRMPRDCLSGPSIAWLIEAPKQTFGMPLEEVEAKYGGEPAWEKAMPGFESLASILKSDSSGRFCLGSKPSYADFIIVGFLEYCRCLGGGIFERTVAIDPAFRGVHDACEPWLERNDR